MNSDVYTLKEMLDWARYYQRVARQYRDRGRLDLACQDYASARRFLFAIIEGRKIVKRCA